MNLKLKSTPINQRHGESTLGNGGIALVSNLKL